MNPKKMKKLLSKVFGGRLRNLPNEGPAPELDGLTGWINSEPLTLSGLRGRVTLIDFWTFSCINCLRTLPQVQAWHETYRDFGLTVIGVHTPEFSFEKGIEAVTDATERLGLTYPMAIDDDYRLWKAYGNRYWPAHYFIDAQGTVRAHHYGEGGYAESEQIIRNLLKKNGADLQRIPRVSSSLPETSEKKDLTPETYLGWDRIEYLGSPESIRAGRAQNYSCPKNPSLNIFYFRGPWKLEGEYAESAGPEAGLVFRFRAAKVYLVASGPQGGAKLDIKLNGQPLSAKNRGSNVPASDDGSSLTVSRGQLYEIVNSDEDYSEKTLELTADREGFRGYAFTFG